MSETEQTSINPFAEMNRYDERHERWLSSAVFAPPRRTLNAGWQKFHAARDCGSGNVYFREETTTRSAHDDKGAYRLVCRACGHRVPEDEVLFIGGEWYGKHGWVAYGRPIDDLRLPGHRVLELGPDPDRDELVEALNLTRIERQVGPFAGGPLRPGRWSDCEGCGHSVPLLYDDHCRMCYDGEWTDALTDSLSAFERKLRVHNDSFVHRLEDHVDPLSISDRCHTDKVLWRKRADEGLPQVVVVEQCLQDNGDGHWEYILSSPVSDREWRYRQADLDEAFYDTGLYVDSEVDGISEQRMAALCERDATTL